MDPSNKQKLTVGDLDEEKYLKGKINFQSAQSSQGDSVVWKEMLKNRDIILLFVQNLVGTGSSISFWEDP